MAELSTIEWTDSTWNPVTGCDKVSAGCANCYAEKFAERWRGVPGHPYEQGFDLKKWPDRLDLPLKWKDPRKIFVNSMSDLFHEEIEDDFILKVFQTMEKADWHVFQVLTKRSSRLVEFANKYFERKSLFSGFLNRGKMKWPSNVWIGVSVENQKFTSRANDLLKVNAPIRFLSVEPLLGPVKFNPSVLKGLQWLIVGGESGPKARPMDPEWARSIKEQCLEHNVPFFFKQWGAYNRAGVRVGKKVAGRHLDGKTWNQMPVLVQ